MGVILAGFLFLLVFAIQIAIYYVAVPFALMVVLGLMGVSISFIPAMLICFLFYVLVGLFKRL